MSSSEDCSRTSTSVKNLYLKLRDWLISEAMPKWSEHGVDRIHGGFQEALDLTSGIGCDHPKRGRLCPRQVYSFIEAAELGWKGPWVQTANDGLSWYLQHYRKGDGTFAALADPDGTITDAGFDLYNQAFALFAFGQVAKIMPERASEMIGEARRLMDILKGSYAHPERGFREDNPDRLPLCSNPHMHMFEACLALETIDSDGPWQELADEIAALAMDCFIDPTNGGLREFFDMDWSPMSGDKGRVMEPGHQFEWAWLLARWGRLRQNASALVKARRLYQIGIDYGLSADGKVAVMALNDDFTLRDPVARLWGQTEWLKSAIILADLSVGIERETYMQDILRAGDALFLYFDAAPSGLWRDKLLPDGHFADDPVPASSFYHIVCAIAELKDFAGNQDA
ncbi:AGE family epimerase/isomerase [Roseibium sp.]|uniref:AGE family epimerase/isomerase n=1 Tax=Roseibium sp. TaxID=1936156 RepID=UPI003A97D741